MGREKGREVFLVSSRSHCMRRIGSTRGLLRGDWHVTYVEVSDLGRWSFVIGLEAEENNAGVGKGWKFSAIRNGHLISYYRSIHPTFVTASSENVKKVHA